MVWARHILDILGQRRLKNNDTIHTFERCNGTGQYLFVNMNQHASTDDRKMLSGFASNVMMHFQSTPLCTFGYELDLLKLIRLIRGMERIFYFI